MSLLIVLASGIVVYMIPDALGTAQRALIWGACTLGAALIFYRKQADEDQSAGDFIDYTAQNQAMGQDNADLSPFSAQGSAVGAQESTTVRQSNAVDEKKSIAGSLYVYEGQIVEAVLNEIHKIPCSISRRIIMAPTFVGYILTDEGHVSVGKLETISEDLGRQVNQHARRFSYGDVDVRVSRSQPLVLQVTRARLKDFTWDNRDQYWNKRPLSTTIGASWYGTRVLPVEIDLTLDHQMSGGFFGSQGSGKSTMARIALINLLQSTSPDKLLVYGIDTKANSFSEFAGVPHMRRYTSDFREALDILREFSRWCLAETRPDDGTYRLLVIDEFHDLLLSPDVGDEAKALMLQIMSKGRAGLKNHHAKIRTWVILQDPDKSNYPSELKKLTSFMVAGFTLYDNYLRDQLGITGASKIKPQKEAIILSADHPDLRFSVFKLTEEIFRSEVDFIKKKWGDQHYPQGIPVSTGSADANEYVEPVYTKDDAIVMRKSTPRDRELAAADSRMSKVASAVLSERKTYTPVRNLQSGALTPAQAEAVRGLAARSEFQRAGRPNVSKLVEHVYMGKRTREKISWIKEAIGNPEESDGD